MAPRTNDAPRRRENAFTLVRRMLSGGVALAKLEVAAALREQECEAAGRHNLPGDFLDRHATKEREIVQQLEIVLLVAGLLGAVAARCLRPSRTMPARTTR